MSPRADRIAQQGEQTRAAAVDAATALFGEHGYRATSLNQIAARAGVVQSALHHHFGSKDALLQAALDAHYQPIQGPRVDMEAVARGEIDFVDQMLRVARENAGDPDTVRFYSVMTGESLTVGHPAHAYFVQRYDRVRTGFTDAIMRAKGLTGAQQRARVETLVAVLLAASDGLQMQWIRDPSIDMIGGIELVADSVRAQLAAITH